MTNNDQAFFEKMKMDDTVSEGVTVFSGILKQVKESSPHLRALELMPPNIMYAILLGGLCKFLTEQYEDIIAVSAAVVGNGDSASMTVSGCRDCEEAVISLIEDMTSLSLNEIGYPFDCGISDEDMEQLNRAAIRIRDSLDTRRTAIIESLKATKQ